MVNGATLEWLSSYRFGGHVDAYREGELYTAGSPVLTVEGTFAEAVLLETIVLSILNFDSAVATAASLITSAAGERPIIEMGSRRVDPSAAVAAARSAYLSGFASTSNLQAGRIYGIPTAGTASHAFVLAYPTEQEAFAAQVAAFGPRTTLLVDTYDVDQGIRNAVEVAGPELGAVRIDSGDLASEAVRARALLDRLGATQHAVGGDRRPRCSHYCCARRRTRGFLRCGCQCRHRNGGPDRRVRVQIGRHRWPRRPLGRGANARWRNDRPGRLRSAGANGRGGRCSTSRRAGARWVLPSSLDRCGPTS